MTKLTNREQLTHTIGRMRAAGMRWRAIAAAFGGDIKPGTIHAVYSRPDYEPRRPAVRLTLGLPLLASVPVCECGDVHTSRRCPRKLTFEERCVRYDVWLAKNKKRIDRIVNALPPLVPTR